MGRKAFIVEGDSWVENKSRRKSIPYVLRTNSLGIGNTYANLNFGAGGDWARDIAANLDRSLSAVRKYAKHDINFSLSAGGNDLLDDANLRRVIAPYSENSFDAIDEGGFAEFGEELANDIFQIVEQIDDCSPGIPIFWNGYDYPIPSNIGVRFFNLVIAGPWIHQPLAQKGYLSPESKRLAVRQLLDTFTALQEEMILYLQTQGANIHFVELRGTVPDEEDWGDEIHPRSQAIVELSRAYKQQVDPIARSSKP